MIGKVLVLLIGTLLGLGTASLALLIPVSLVVVGLLTMSVLLSSDRVPIMYSLRALWARKISTLLTGLGLAMVVFIFTTVFMLAHGIRMTLVSTGSHDNIMVIRKGSTTEVQSSISAEQVRLLGANPMIAIGPEGQPMIATESLGIIFLPRVGMRNDEEGANVTVRGVGPHALTFHDHVKLEGRLMQPGTSEVVVGKALVGRFNGMQLGGQIYFARRQWTVVGIMDAQGTAFDSELWADTEQLNDALQRRGIFSSIILRLKDPTQLASLRSQIESDQQLNSLEPIREKDYYATQSGSMANFVQFLGIFVTSIFAFAAALGAMITMYMQVGARTHEVGVLRALGFHRRAVLVAFILESIMLGIFSGLVGIAAASLMRFATFSTTNFQTFSETSFHFDLTLNIFGTALLFSAILGYCGGLLPAIRASSMSIVEMLAQRR